MAAIFSQHHASSEGCEHPPPEVLLQIDQERICATSDRPCSCMHVAWLITSRADAVRSVKHTDYSNIAKPSLKEMHHHSCATDQEHLSCLLCIVQDVLIGFIPCQLLQQYTQESHTRNELQIPQRKTACESQALLTLADFSVKSDSEVYS